MARKKSTELGAAVNPAQALEDLRRRVNRGETISAEESSNKRSKSKAKLDDLLAEQQRKEDEAAIARDVNNPAGKKGARVAESTREERRRREGGKARRGLQTRLDQQKVNTIVSTLKEAAAPTKATKTKAASATPKLPAGPKKFSATSTDVEAATPASAPFAMEQAAQNTAGFDENVKSKTFREAYRLPPKGSRPGSFGGANATDKFANLDPGMSEHLRVLHGLASKLTEHLNTLNDVTQRTIPGSYYQNFDDLTRVSTSIWHHLGMAALHESKGEVLSSKGSSRTNPFQKPVAGGSINEAQKMYESTDSDYKDALKSVPKNEVMTGEDDIGSASSAVDHARLAAKHIGTLAVSLEKLSGHVSGQPVPASYYAKTPPKKQLETDVAGFSGTPVASPGLPSFPNSVSTPDGKTHRWGELATSIANKYEQAAVGAASSPENKDLAVSLAAWRQNNPFGDTAKLAEAEAERQAYKHQQRIELGLPPHSSLTLPLQGPTFTAGQTLGGKLLSNAEEAAYRRANPARPIAPIPVMVGPKPAPEPWKPEGPRVRTPKEQEEYDSLTRWAREGIESRRLPEGVTRGMPVSKQQAPKKNEFVGLAAGRAPESIASTFTPTEPSARAKAATAKASAAAAPRVNANGVRLLTTSEYNKIDGDFNTKTQKFTYSSEDRPAVRLYEAAARRAADHWSSVNLAPTPLNALSDPSSTEREKLQKQHAAHNKKWQSSLANTDPHEYVRTVMESTPATAEKPAMKFTPVPGATSTSRAAKNLSAFRGE